MNKRDLETKAKRSLRENGLRSERWGKYGLLDNTYASVTTEHGLLVCYCDCEATARKARDILRTVGFDVFNTNGSYNYKWFYLMEAL